MKFPTHRPNLTEPNEVFTTWTHACSDVETDRARQLRRALPELTRWSDTELMCAWRLYTLAINATWTDVPSADQQDQCHDFRMYLMVLTLSPRLRHRPVTDDTYLETLDLIRSLKPRADRSARPTPTTRPATPRTRTPATLTGSAANNDTTLPSTSPHRQTRPR